MRCASFAASPTACSTSRRMSSIAAFARRRVRVHLHARELEVDRERHEMLLHAPVQLALDRAAVGVGRENEPLARCAQRRELAAQLVERLGERVGGHGRSCASSRRRSQGASTRVVVGQPPGRLAC